MASRVSLMGRNEPRIGPVTMDILPSHPLFPFFFLHQGTRYFLMLTYFPSVNCVRNSFRDTQLRLETVVGSQAVETQDSSLGRLTLNLNHLQMPCSRADLPSCGEAPAVSIKCLISMGEFVCLGQLGNSFPKVPRQFKFL